MHFHASPHLDAPSSCGFSYEAQPRLRDLLWTIKATFHFSCALQLTFWQLLDRSKHCKHWAEALPKSAIQPPISVMERRRAFSCTVLWNSNVVSTTKLSSRKLEEVCLSQHSFQMNWQHVWLRSLYMASPEPFHPLLVTGFLLIYSKTLTFGLFFNKGLWHCPGMKEGNKIMWVKNGIALWRWRQQNSASKSREKTDTHRRLFVRQLCWHKSSYCSSLYHL